MLFSVDRHFLDKRITESREQKYQIEKHVVAFFFSFSICRFLDYSELDVDNAALPNASACVDFVNFTDSKATGRFIV